MSRVADALDAARAAVPIVRESLTAKSLYFSIEEVQSRMQLRRPDALDLRYTRTMMGFLMFAPAPRDILMIGLGGGSLAKFCHRHLPKCRFEAVEINPRVIALRDQFGIPPDGPRFRVVEADGAAFLRASVQRYDVVLLDAFGPGGLPPPLGTQRFYDDCLDALQPGGVLVANFHSAARDLRQCIERIDRSFGAALVIPDREALNSIVFARREQALVARPPAPAGPPKGLDKAAWTQLAGACGRIASALARQAEGAQTGAFD